MNLAQHMQEGISEQGEIYLKSSIFPNNWSDSSGCVFWPNVKLSRLSLWQRLRGQGQGAFGPNLSQKAAEQAFKELTFSGGLNADTYGPGLKFSLCVCVCILNDFFTSPCLVSQLIMETMMKVKLRRCCFWNHLSHLLWEITSPHKRSTPSRSARKPDEHHPPCPLQPPRLASGGSQWFFVMIFSVIISSKVPLEVQPNSWISIFKALDSNNRLMLFSDY